MAKTAFLLFFYTFLHTGYGYDCPRQCRELGSVPVCGSDSVIYASDCELRKRNCGQSVVTALPSLSRCTEGKSSCRAFCYDHRDPVCGANGVTYENECKWAIRACFEGIRFSHPGMCINYTRVENCPSACPPRRGFLEKPICASNGNVYRSECEMKRQTCGQKVTMASFSHCKSTQHCLDHCDKSYNPACGSDGRIYTNNCIMKQQNCGRHVYQVPMVFCLGNNANKYGCPTKCKSLANETSCGTDGFVYDSECEIRMLHCGSLNKDVSPAPLGFCHSRLDRCRRKICGDIFNPVCGSDGKTYTNDCTFQVAVCRKGITRGHDGICHNLNNLDSCPDFCPPITNKDEPVCGSDGNVYPNACEMKKRSCGRRVVPVKRTLCRMTAYCDINCPVEAGLRPVCGSDGNLYMSECHMFNKNCGKHIFEVPLENCLRGLRVGCKEFCPPVQNPVCGTDGNAYSNNCFLSLETCRTRGKVRMDPSWSCNLPASQESEMNKV